MEGLGFILWDTYRVLAPVNEISQEKEVSGGHLNGRFWFTGVRCS